MKISMWNIFSELRQGCATPLIEDGSPVINQCRLILEASNEPGSVLMGNGSDFFRSDVDVIIVCGYDMIIVNDASLEEVFNEVCNIINLYQKWETSLLAAKKTSDGLQAMIDCSYLVIHHPIFIYGRDGNALAISSHFPPSIHWLWKEIVETQGLTEYRMQSLKEDIQLTTVFQDAKPTIRESSIDESYKYMHCSLRANGFVVAHLVLFSFDHPFEPGLDQLVENLVKQGDAYIDDHVEQFELASDSEQIVRAMLTGDQYTAPALLDVLNARGWRLDDKFRTHVLREDVQGEPVLVTRAFTKLVQKLDNVAATRHGRSILVLENVSKGGPSRSVAWVHEHEPSIHRYFACGTSAPFHNITQCSLYYEQALEELNRARSSANHRSSADEHCADHFMQLLSNDPLARTYIRPELQTLHDYDRIHGTAYCETLRAYALCGFQGTHTARMLGIHRNSLLYRLDRIREIIDFSPYDAFASRPSMRMLGEIIASFSLLDGQTKY